MEYYTPLKTPNIESEGGVDIDDVNVEQRRNNSKLTETIIERIIVKIKKAKYKNIGEVMQHKASQLPSIVELSKSENNLKNCNLFLEDYNEYNATKILFKR
jgi:hypothetical protein